MNRILTTLLFTCFTVLAIAQKQTYQVGFMFDELNNETMPLLEQLKTEIQTVVGEDALIEFSSQNELVNDLDFEKATRHYAELLERTDIIISFGFYSNVVISGQKTHPKPTILIGDFSSGINGFEADKETSGIDNLTYMVTSNSNIEDLRKFKELAGGETLGVVIGKPLVEIVDFKKRFDEIATELKADYKIIPFDDIEDITSNLDGIDAVYMVGTFFLKEQEVQQLAEAFITKKIPSFSSVRKQDVANGILATYSTDGIPQQFFRRIALSIEAYVNGQNFSTMPVAIDFEKALTINYNTAQAIGLPIKYSLIGQTSFVGDKDKNPAAKIIYDLPLVLDNVLNENLLLKSSGKDVEVSNQDVKSAKSNYFPNLSVAANGAYIDPDLAAVSGGQNPEYTTNGTVTLKQTLFSEGANANISIQKSLAKAQQEGFNIDQLDVIFNASNAYFNALILKANVNIQIQNLELTKRNLQIAEHNFEAGQSGKTDLLRFRSQMAQNTQTTVQALNQLEQGFVGLNQLLNNPPGLEIDIKDADLDDAVFEGYNYNQFFEILDNPVLREPFISFLEEEALNNSPELKQLGYSMDATERSIKLYGTGRLLPTLGLQGQYNHQFNRSGAGSDPLPGFPDGYYNVGVNLSLPIFNQNSNQINKQTAIIQKEKLAINQDNVELAITSNIRNSVLNMVTQMSNITLSKVSEQTAKESLDLTQSAYSDGAVNIVQLLDAQSNYLNAQLARATATYNYLLSALQLERNLGYYFLLNSDEENAVFRQRFMTFLNERN